MKFSKYDSRNVLRSSDAGILGRGISKNCFFILLFGALILFQFSCRTKSIHLSVYGVHKDLVEIYAGHEIILQDTLNKSTTTGFSFGKQIRYNFRDSLLVNLYVDNEIYLSQKVKLKKCKHIIIDIYGIELKVYGCDTLPFRL